MEGESGHDRVGGQAQAQVQGHQAGRSASSSFSELFGDKDSRANGVFGSVFSAPSVPPPSSSSPSLSSSQWSSSSKGNGISVPDDSCRKDGDDQSDENTKNVSDISIQKDNEKGLKTEQQMEGIESFYLSSSLYYGGQDICAPSPTSQAPGNSQFPRDGNEDDPIFNSSNSASRGNWWQGSLYY